MFAITNDEKQGIDWRHQLQIVIRLRQQRRGHNYKWSKVQKSAIFTEAPKIKINIKFLNGVAPKEPAWARVMKKDFKNK